MLRIPPLQTLDVFQVDEFVDDGVDCKASGGVDLQLAGYITAVGGDGMHREVQCLGYLLVGHSFSYADDDLLLARAERVGAGHIARRLALLLYHIALLAHSLLDLLDGWHKEAILHLTVRGEILLAVDDIEQDRV